MFMFMIFIYVHVYVNFNINIERKLFFLTTGMVPPWELVPYANGIL